MMQRDNNALHTEKPSRRVESRWYTEDTWDRQVLPVEFQCIEVSVSAKDTREVGRL